MTDNEIKTKFRQLQDNADAALGRWVMTDPDYDLDSYLLAQDESNSADEALAEFAAQHKDKLSNMRLIVTFVKGYDTPVMGYHGR